MEPHEYQTLREVESSHWWFRALRNVLLDTCGRLGLGRSSRILDAGCGTGKVADVLRQAVSPNVIGMDCSLVAAQQWARGGLRVMCAASVNAMPFQDEAFDAVLGIDVLECDGVNERQAAQECWRVLRKGGYLILIVPAYNWLMSPEHHRAVQASRRYTPARLRRVVGQTPLRVVRISHLFQTLFLPIAGYRLWRRWQGWRDNGSPRSELHIGTGPANEWLFRAVDWERHLLPVMNLPFGSSILAVVQKPAA